MKTTACIISGRSTRVLLAAVLLAGTPAAWGQTSVRTNSFAFGKPVLVLRGEIAAANGDSMLSAGAGGTLALSISNTGQATARNPVLVVVPGRTLKDVAVVRRDTLDSIAPGETRSEKIALGVPETAPAQKGALRISICDDSGSANAETSVDIAVRAVPFPKFSATITGPPEGLIGGEHAVLKAHVTNTGKGNARGVTATIVSDSTMLTLLGAGNRPAGQSTRVSIDTLLAGQTRDITVSVRLAKGAAGSVPIYLRIADARSKYAFVDTLALPVISAAARAEALAFEAFTQGDYRRAAGMFAKLASAGRPSAQVYYALGVSYFRLQNGAKCVAVMQKASSLGSEDAKTWLASHATTVEDVTVTYTKRTTNPFEGYTPPIGIGILPFTDMQMQSMPLTDTIYEALKKKNKTFRIFPNSTILSEQTALGLTSVAPSNKEILAGLERDFSMNFAVGGTTADSTAAVFTLQILRCRDGETVWSQEFRNSKSSTAVDDAVRFLLEGRVPLYKRSRNVELNPQ